MLDTEKIIQSFDEKQLPPVELWDPEYCGDSEITINAEGQWFYQNSPIGRKKLQILFSRVIKKEEQDYFLVTPNEKLSLSVEWMPFTIIDFDFVDHQGCQTLKMRDNCNNEILLTNKNQWRLNSFQEQQLPIVLVRRNLYANFNRSCYYRLLESANIVSKDDQNQVYIKSNHINFNCGSFTTE